MKRRTILLIVITIFSLHSFLIGGCIIKVNAVDPVLDGNINWYPTEGSNISIKYNLSQSLSDSQYIYSLNSFFTVNLPVQLNGTFDDWIIGSRNFSIQIYARIASNFYLFQHHLNYSAFGIVGNEFGDPFIFSLPQSYDSIQIDYSVYSYLKKNTTLANIYSSGSSALTVRDDKNNFYPKSFEYISVSLQFYLENLQIYTLNHTIHGDKKTTPIVDMSISLSQFSYELHPRGIIDNIPIYSTPRFTIGCGISEISYINSPGFINSYIKKTEMIASNTTNISKDDMNTGILRQMTVSNEEQDFDAINFLYLTDLYLFDWYISYTFEIKPSMFIHFVRTFYPIIITVGIIGIIVTGIMIIIKRKSIH